MIMSVPVGYLITTALAAIGALLAIAPLRRPPLLAALSFRLGLIISELPFVVFYYLAASTALAISQHDVTSAGGWTALALGVLATVGLGVVVWQARQTGPAVHAALAEALGDGWPQDSAATVALLRRLPLGRIVFQPFFARRFSVAKLANISYGDAGRRNRLDLYRHRSQPVQAPVLIHLHGGRFVHGRKSRQAMPLLYRLASQGWVCISANYRLSPAATFPDFLIDVKKVLAWVRENGSRYGADPATVFVAGSSAGAHLAAMAALTPNDPAFQPGFEEADTSVIAAITLGGYYGPLDSDGRLPRHRRWPASTPGRRHSSSRTAPTTPSSGWTWREPWPASCGRPQTTPSSTPNSPGRSTRSTCSTRCASTSSSTASRPSPRT